MKHYLRYFALLMLLPVMLLSFSGAVLAETLSETELQLKDELGAFEITAMQRELAANNKAGLSALDAGRGNPNWINTQARYAFTRFMEFAIGECELTMNQSGMAGQAKQDGIGARFDEAMNPDDATDAFLISAVKYCTDELSLDKDEILKELTDAVIGDYYPSPSRCLKAGEVILNDYIRSTLCNGVDLSKETLVFPTEGGTAAMCYTFHSLSHNRILKPGDKIAIATPIFTPYLQIPDVNSYDLVAIDISATAENDWDIPDAEFDKLADPTVKAFFLVNPSNPASRALSEASIEKLAAAVEKNPNLIILTDDVYGTFADEFTTVYARLPYNTILVYSFSKLYGVTGWRIGLIAMNRNNVVDKLLRELPEEDRDFLNDEYRIVTDEPESLSAMERIVADSRSIGLYHTSGLSTPQQVFMELLALTHLVNETDDAYIDLANETVYERYLALMDALGMEADESDTNAYYYTLIDLKSLTAAHYGEDFSMWMSENVDELDFLNSLAEEYGVVLMYGPGFDAPENTVRVSLANLNLEDYREIGRRMFLLLDEYFEEYSALADAA